jgi:glycosyltransferase involved in cell wall biosynthesis
MKSNNFDSRAISGVNIMYVIPNMISGGIEKNVVEVANHFIERGVNVYVLTTECKMFNLLDSRVNVVLHDVKTKNFFKIIYNSFKIKAICRELKIDIIHVKSRAPAWSVWLASKMCNVKTVATVHGIYNISTKLKRFYSKAMMSQQVVIAVSEFAKNYVLNNFDIDEERLYTIPRGIDFSFYSKSFITKSRLAEAINSMNLSHTDKKIILFPGRLSNIKGQELLVEALRYLERKDYLCIILGDSGKSFKLKNKIFNKIVEYKLEENVYFVENVSDMRGAYTFAHVVLCLSTKAESFGRVPIEAGAMCRPSIVSDIGGLSQSVIENKTGWFVVPSSMEDIIEKINIALDLPRDEWEKMCSEARTYCSKYFDINTMFRNTEMVYLNLLNNL